MSDESHIARLDQEDLSLHEEKLQAWAHSLGTTPERLREILRGEPWAARQLRQLVGIAQASRDDPAR
jgi:hypothetical protein